jgi:hypothetical protein
MQLHGGRIEPRVVVFVLADVISQKMVHLTHDFMHGCTTRLYGLFLIDYL